MAKKIAIVVNIDWFFVSHRLPIALKAIENGYEVFLLTNDTGKRQYIESLGIKFYQIPFSRSGVNPLKEILCVIRLMKCFRSIKPNVIHNVTLKASLLGSIAAKLLNIKNVINAISGFGYTFTDGRHGIFQHIVKSAMDFAYKSKYSSFILQNPDDYNEIRNMNYVPEQNLFLIRGSGIDLNTFSYHAPNNHDKLVFMLPARMLKDKGVVEFVEAAKLIKNKYFNSAVFKLIGDIDSDNPSGIKKEYLDKESDGIYIIWLGYKTNMISEYIDSDIVVLPSYREGLPKSLIEANAIGRPIISTDVPGCRECVRHKKNGLLVPAKDVNALAKAFKFFINNKNVIEEYGKYSRYMAEKYFSINNVVNEHMKIYNHYLEPASSSCQIHV